MDKITLGSGCFWCTEAVFQNIKGIYSITSGYEGGKTENPTYGDICTGITGHAECIQIMYDSSIISLDIILDIFFYSHDPTQLNQQGPDRGTQYRSVIFYHTNDQKEIAIDKIDQLNKMNIWNDAIVTEISPTSVFYPAEDYHQEYYNNNKFQPYCQVMISPKLEKLRDRFYKWIK